MRHGWRPLRTVLFSVFVLLVVGCVPLWLPLLGSLWRTAPSPSFCWGTGDSPRVTMYNLTVSSLVESAGTVYALGTALPTGVPNSGRVASTTLYALRASDGVLLWQQPIEATVTLLADQDTLYLSSPFFLEARRASDGTVLWMRSGDNAGYGQEASLPMLDQGVLYLSGRARIFAIRASDGQTVWDVAPGSAQASDQPGDSPYSQLVVSDGLVAVGLLTGVVVALRESDGAVLWQTKVEYSPGPALTRPIAGAAGHVYVSAGQGVQVLGASDGHGEGTLAGLEDGRFARGTVADSVLYTTTGQTAYAVRVTDDRLLWHTPLHSEVEAPQVAQGLIYFPGASHLLQAADGSPLHPLDQTGDPWLRAIGPSGVYQVMNGYQDTCSPGSNQPIMISAWHEPDHAFLWTTSLPLPS